MDALKILVVDDESRMRKLVHDFLAKAGYQILEAEDGAQALDIYFANSDIALVILDVMMPKLNGYEVLKEIRAYSKVPVVMLTARGEEHDELKGFELGVDEYITKPFSPKILVARVQALLRRNKENTGSEVLEVGAIRLDKTAHTVTVAGKNVDLSYKEFELLTYLMENKGIALSREKDDDRLLGLILHEAMEMTSCDGGTLYIYDGESLKFHINGSIFNILITLSHFMA